MWEYNRTDELYHYGVLGMKWGRRKDGGRLGVSSYQNKDKTLTERGKKRYERDVLENNAKKKENRMVINGPDPNRWVREDMTRVKKSVDAVNSIVSATSKIHDTVPKKQKVDLSNMTDKELRDRINRANLEKQYVDTFSKETTSKGRQFAQSTLSVAGTALTTASTIIGLALAIKELRG